MADDTQYPHPPSKTQVSIIFTRFFFIADCSAATAALAPTNDGRFARHWMTARSYHVTSSAPLHTRAQYGAQELQPSDVRPGSGRPNPEP